MPTDSVVAELDLVSCAQLFEMDLQPPREVIPGLIVVGMNILGGNPKSGKVLRRSNLLTRWQLERRFLGESLARAVSCTWHLRTICSGFAVVCVGLSLVPPRTLTSRRLRQLSRVAV